MSLLVPLSTAKLASQLTSYDIIEAPIEHLANLTLRNAEELEARLAHFGDSVKKRRHGSKQTNELLSALAGNAANLTRDVLSKVEETYNASIATLDPASSDFVTSSEPDTGGFRRLLVAHNFVLSLSLAMGMDLTADYEIDPAPFDHYCRSVQKWIADTASRPDEQVGTEPPSTSQLAEAIGGLSLADSQFATRSPLESALRSAGYTSSARCEVHLFLNWILESKFPRAASFSRFGALRSAHHFRSRKKPFNHEYIVLCFVTAGGEESVVRLERAAFLGPNPYLPLPDNLAPLYRGVQAREWVSFACSKNDLVVNSDELATLHYDGSGASSSDDHQSKSSLGTRFLVTDLALEVTRTKGTHTQYRIFTTNCRWFARQLFLNLVEFSENSHTLHQLTWRGKHCLRQRIEEKLGKEWFGGGQLKGTKAVFLRAENTLALAVRLLEDDAPALAHQLCSGVISSIEQVVPEEEEVSKKDFLLCYALMTDGDALSLAGDVRKGLAALERAVKHGRAISWEYKALYTNCLTRYADALFRLDEVSKACEMMERAVAVTKDFITSPRHFKADLVSFRLNQLGLYLRKLGDLPKARQAYEEALDIILPEYAIEPEKFDTSVPILWRDLSSLLSQMGLHENACAAAKNGIKVAKKRTSLDSPSLPNQASLELAILLRALAEAQLASGNVPSALESAGESIRTLETFVLPSLETAPPRERNAYFMALNQYASILNGLGREAEAVPTLRSCVPVLKSLVKDEPWHPDHRANLSTTLQNLSLCVYKQNVDEAFACMEQAVELERTMFQEDKAGKATFVDALESFAELLKVMKLRDKKTKVLEELKAVQNA
ncbi:uncharacterized protein EI90DRAFT_3117821 [Cantharellus anzutake]|uniref:uncharacterized protein n=1 Tax=Cantharellus anzutake TaxID=1750568 RepID=UPI001903AA11|nr:uncharacterized protein EI90DRAFT_3117821 [Cantharellus anzutake]KAF8338731.1 hypothetical protein EI90DRAFT_3117821 [Cantharellus anzutake]